VGCGAEVDDTEPVDGACGEVTEHRLNLLAKVVDGGGLPVAGATVRLEERLWDPRTVGSATTDGTGEASLSNLAITGVEDCWGTALDYVLVAEMGAQSDEENVNSRLFGAVSVGDATVDRRDRPLVLP
jgi:hypothetical protein